MNKLKDLVFRLFLWLTKPLLPLLAWITTSVAINDRAFGYFKKRGYVFLKEHYYLPLPVGGEVALSLQAKKSDLIGLTFSTPESMNMLTTVYPKYRDEFTAWLRQAESTNTFQLYNGTYMAVDAEMYYTMIRHYKPGQIVEIGSGKSTIIAAAAVAQNQAVDQVKTSLTCIEPFPNDIVKSGIAHIKGLTTLIPDMVQNVDLGIFSSLQANDIVFIDSTHVLKQGGDVQFIYNEIIPRLRTGVIIHVHDISLPEPYPPVYYEQHLYWNEQYLLQALLTHNPRYLTLWPGTYMALHHREQLLRGFPTLEEMYKRYPQSNPSSFWFTIVS